MSGIRTVVGDAITSILKEFPNHPTKTLARLLCEKEPVLFKNLENARGQLRAYRGNCGYTNRKWNYGYSKFYRPKGKVTDAIIPLPKSLAPQDPNRWNVFELGCKDCLSLQDLHIPYHDDKALEIALHFGEQQKVDTILLNGDVVDFYAVSSWERDPRQRDVSIEVEAVKAFFEHLRGRFPKAKIIWKEGNHEERYWRYGWRVCPEMFHVRMGNGQRIFDLGALFDAEEYDIQVITDKRPIRIGKHLIIVHGHEFGRRLDLSVNAARGLWRYAKCNCACGDVHVSSSNFEKGLDKSMSTWSMGCLCDLHPVYRPINPWNHGFGIISLDKEQWDFKNYKIIGGQVVSA